MDVHCMSKITLFIVLRTKIFFYLMFSITSLVILYNATSSAA